MTTQPSIQYTQLNDQHCMKYEEEIARNPFYLKGWLKYLEYKSNSSSTTDRYVIYERALKYLPRSYKLWFNYLSLRRNKLQYVSIADKRFQILRSTFERSLVHMHKMPVIWCMYLEVLTEMSLGTITRKTFDRALQSLPITQHEPIWERYLEWTKKFNIPETTIPIYRRYLQYNPSYREELVSYLENISQYEEAARQLSICINDDNFIPISGSTKHQLWMRLCDMCAQHPVETSRSLKVEAVIRSGIQRFSDEVGRLWTRLADYYIRLGQFERARDIYEEAMQAVTTVRDFTLIFDSYLKCEENILMATMREAEELEKEIISPGDVEGEEEEGKEKEENEKLLESLNGEIELRLARLEYLTERRPILLNSVMLRQNPHNVYEWHKRIKLYRGDIPRMLMTYMEAIKTVATQQAHGKLSTLWLGLAKLYEDNSDLTNCREVYKKASQVEYRSIDELAYVWCQWTEMELRHFEYLNGLQIMKMAVTEPKTSLQRKKLHAIEQGKSKISSKVEDMNPFSTVSVVDKLHRNVKIWSFYLDLEESFGSIESCRAAYDRMIELKTITPQILLNYTNLLQEHHFYEDSFRIFEKGVVLFSFPSVKIIWIEYFTKFIERYEGTKLERLRDLFEQSLIHLPQEYISEFYIRYATAEEKYGLIRHAMTIYHRAIKLLPADGGGGAAAGGGGGGGGGGANGSTEKYDMYCLYLKKIESYYGVTKTRVVYEEAIREGLGDDKQVQDMCLKYSEMETKLGEIDRARAIFQHGSQFADPRVYESYWSQWRKFEEAHGNLDTFKDMLRVQRSIETAYSQVNYLARDMVNAATAAAGGNVEIGMGEGVEGIAKQAELDAMQRAQMKNNTGAAANDDSQSNKRKFVPASNSVAYHPPAKIQAVENGSSAAPGIGAGRNVDEIDIDDLEENTEPVEIQQKAVPAAVFGNVVSLEAASASSSAAERGPRIGALDRFNA